LRKSSRKFQVVLALVVAMVGTAFAVAPAGASAACNFGGLTAAETDLCTPTAKANLLASGELIPPANRIRLRPYIYGGGHASFASRGYDCSGSVSFALHGGNFLTSPLPSGPLESWGEEGEGRWITVYANAGHAYMTVAGYRFDTAGDEGAGETGPRWHEVLPSNEGFVARHPAGF
jgi:hypothetical protein